jgi:hypothetical protein
MAPCQAILRTTALDAGQWLLCTAVALSIIAVTEFRKAFLRPTVGPVRLRDHLDADCVLDAACPRIPVARAAPCVARAHIGGLWQDRTDWSVRVETTRGDHRSLKNSIVVCTAAGVIRCPAFGSTASSPADSAR